jgi:hypothetical protein
MAILTQDVEDDPDDHEHASALVVLALNRAQTVLVAAAVQQHLGEIEHLTYDVQLAKRKVGTAMRVSLEADRVGVVGPALDAMCAELRELPGDARIAVPGWTRVFYGWERSVWDDHGRIRAEAR